MSATVLVALVLLIGCARRPGGAAPAEEDTAAGPPLDPLSTVVDREVAPEVYPLQPAAAPGSGDSLIDPLDVSYQAFDSSLSQASPTEVYRVQIFTSRLYNEAARERSIADEIFNLPVYLDYEVPYYKLRVGDFLTREAAEDMVSEIRSLGYRGAWVARVVLRVNAPPPYDEDDPLLPSPAVDSTLMTEPPPDSIEAGGE